MSDVNDLIIATLNNLDNKVEKIDSKIDDMQKVHIKNTAVLEEHERRSTASEKRIETLEQHEAKRAEQAAKIKGFFLIGSLLLTAFGGLVYFLVNITELVANVRTLLGH